MKNNRMMIRFLADYFYINIFILDIQDDKIYVNYPEEQFNIFKMNLFLIFYNDVFEPLINENKLWNYNQEYIKKLINVNSSNINVFNDNFSKDYTDKVFQIGSEDLTKYLNNNNDDDNEIDEDCDNKYEEIITEDDTNDYKLIEVDTTETEMKVDNDMTSDVFVKCNKNDKIELPDINMKMKLSELQQLAVKHNISLVSGKTKSGKDKYKTKKILLNDLKRLL
jgi:hypothetical protein